MNSINANITETNLGAHGGSHDHFISDDRLEIETFDANGKRVQWGIGPTQAELEAAHISGKCHAFCAYCITEAEQLMTPNAPHEGSEPKAKLPLDAVVGPHTEG